MTPTRFVTDASLAVVARRLRQLGYDVELHRGARLEELLEVAARDGRTVLTRSARKPKRWSAVATLRVEDADPGAAVRSVAGQAEASGAPLSRCSHCNHPLRVRSAFEAHGEIPGRVARRGGPLWSCTGCGQWFWLGSHTDKLRGWFERALGRTIAWPEIPPREEGRKPHLDR